MLSFQILASYLNFFTQRELFAAKADSGGGAVDRKLSSSSAGSMKNKWLKAFRSLKPPSAPPPHAAPPDKYVLTTIIYVIHDLFITLVKNMQYSSL